MQFIAWVKKHFSNSSHEKRSQNLWIFCIVEICIKIYGGSNPPQNYNILRINKDNIFGFYVFWTKKVR